MTDQSTAAAEPMPRRIQRSRAKGWRMPPNTVYVGRPTVWQNPYGLPGTNALITEATREECVRSHREMVANGPPMAFPQPVEDRRIHDPRQMALICEAAP